MDTIGFVGSGNMAEALIKGVLSANLYGPADICIADVCKDRLEYLAGEYKICAAGSNAAVASRAEVVVLSVKPQNIFEVLEEIKGSLKNDAVVISIAAGVTTEKISGCLGQVQVIRVMPNTPALIGRGVSALYSSSTTADAMQMAVKLFSAVGKVVVVENEELIDAVTAISGSGPAYFFLMMEEMERVAEQFGLSSDVARELVLQTACGAAMLAAGSESSPSELRKKVTSPGGTTEAAIKVFTENRFSELVTKALTAARDRSVELS
jgi:pyrroline-5-carboxylate reductase